MIYLKKNEETQIVNIPKNGEYEGKKTYKEGYDEGYNEGLYVGKLTPYTTKGVFDKNGYYDRVWAIDWSRNVEMPISWLDNDNIIEVSFFALENSALISTSGAFIDIFLQDEKMIVNYKNFMLEIPCKYQMWHTLKLQGRYVYLNGERYEYPNFDEYFNGTAFFGKSRRNGMFCRSLVSYIYVTEDNGVEMYYYYGREDGKVKRLRNENGNWIFQTMEFGVWNYATNTPPMDDVLVRVEGGNCPELTELNVSQNGRYEGAYNVVNVDVPQEVGSCNLQDKWVEYNSPDELTDSIFVDVYPDEGYDGMSRVVADVRGLMQYKYDEGYDVGKAEGGGSCNIGSLDSDTNTIPHNDNLLWGYVNELSPELDGWEYISIDYRPLRKEIAEQTKNKIVNELQTLTITENGIYTPPTTSFLRLDSDDKYELFGPTDVNAFEIKFRVNGSDDTEFFSQDNQYDFIGIKACSNISTLYVNWYNKQISISDVDFSKWHTLVVKMLDENARVILDGQVYNSYIENSSYESNGNNIYIYGNIDLEYLNFWNTWEEYNDGDIPFFYFKVSPEGLMRSYRGEEYSLVENIGGGSAQYLEEKLFLGYSEVNVDVPTEGGSCNTGDLIVEWQSDWNKNEYYAFNDGLDGYSYVQIIAENALNEKYNEGYEAGKAEGGSCNLTELNIEWQSDWNENNYYADKQGYDGYSYVHIDVTTALKEKYDEGYNFAINNDANLTPSKVEKKFNTLALRTENLFDSDIIRDRTKLRGFYDESAEDYFIAYTQNKNGVVICEHGEFSKPSVTTIENDALNWNTIEYFYSYTITTFGENMTRDMSSNVRQIHLDTPIMNTDGADIVFRSGCFATSNLLNKIVFYKPLKVMVYDNAFEGVSSSGKVIVVGIDMSENRAKYDDLMAQLGDGWTLTFVDEYDE